MLYKQKPEIAKACPVCDKLFYTTREAKVYCSEACKVQARVEKKRKPPVITCEGCGKPFERQGSQRYCSDACRKAAQKRSRLYETVTVACTYCGREFSYEGRRSGADRRRLFCSKKCEREKRKELKSRNLEKMRKRAEKRQTMPMELVRQLPTSKPGAVRILPITAIEKPPTPSAKIRIAAGRLPDRGKPTKDRAYEKETQTQTANTGALC